MSQKRWLEGRGVCERVRDSDILQENVRGKRRELSSKNWVFCFLMSFCCNG